MNYRWTLAKHRTLFEKYFRLDEYSISHELFAGGSSPVFTREIFERGHAGLEERPMGFELFRRPVVDARRVEPHCADLTLGDQPAGGIRVKAREVQLLDR